MTLFLTVLHVLVCIFMIVVVLLQRGKGAEVGAVFGGGASNTVFGSRGAGNFLTKMTTTAAVIFMVTSLSLAYFTSRDDESTLFEGEPTAAEQQGAAGETGAGEAGGDPGGTPGAPGAPQASGATEGSGESGAASRGEGAASEGSEAAPSQGGGEGLSAASEEESSPSGDRPARP